MSIRKLLLSIIFTAAMSSGLVGCSDDGDKDEAKSGEHIWKHQTDTLQTSKDVAKQLQHSLDQQQKNMDENN